MVKNGKKWPEIANNCKISEITKYGEEMTKIAKNVNNWQKRDKNGQKMAKFKKNVIVFLARNYLKKLTQWAETAKNVFKWFKMH